MQIPQPHSVGSACLDSSYLINHAVSTTREPRPRYALPEPDHSTNYQLPTTFPVRMQPSRPAKDVPARMNRLLGINTRLNLDPNHAGPMDEKTKTSWEHFYNYLFSIKRGKACGTLKKSLLVCNEWIEERGVGCGNYAATYQSGHRGDLTRE